MDAGVIQILFAGIDRAAPEMETRLIDWANVNSGSTNAAGLQRMAARLGDALRMLGAEVELVALAGVAAPMIRARRRTSAPVQVLLSGHFDTVYGETHPFQQCTRVDADTLRGPGVADMKGGLVVLLEALRAFEQTPAAERVGWEVVLTPDEETGSVASAQLLREAARGKHVGIVFEPAFSDGNLVGSRSGVGVVHVAAHGRAAHAGRDFASGRNAIVAVSHLIAAAHFLNGALPDVIVNAGAVEGGGTLNIVPERASAAFNIRAQRAGDGEETLRRLREAAAVISRATEVRLELEGGFQRPPLEESDASRHWLRAWCESASALGLELTWRHSGGGSDANLLAAAGLPCVDGAGVEGGELHSEREWVRLSSLARRAKIAALFLARLAAGEIA